MSYYVGYSEALAAFNRGDHVRIIREAEGSGYWSDWDGKEGGDLFVLSKSTKINSLDSINYKHVFEVLQHAATYYGVRINAYHGKLSFFLPVQSNEEVAYLAERGCVWDEYGAYTLNVGINTASNYAKWQGWGKNSDV